MKDSNLEHSVVSVPMPTPRILLWSHRNTHGTLSCVRTELLLMPPLSLLLSLALTLLMMLLLTSQKVCLTRMCQKAMLANRQQPEASSLLTMSSRAPCQSSAVPLALNWTA